MNGSMIRGTLSLIEEVPPGAPGFGKLVHLMIDVFGDILEFGEWAFAGEVNRDHRFIHRGFVYGGEALLSEVALLDQAGLPELDRIEAALVTIDLIRRPVHFLFSVGNGMAEVPVGVDFDDGWTAFLMGAFDGNLHLGA